MKCWEVNLFIQNYKLIFISYKIVHRLSLTKFDTFSSVFYQHHNYSNLISTLIAQRTLLSVKTLHGCGDCHLFFSFPCNLNTKKQYYYNMWEKQRGMIFLSIIDLLTVSLPLTAKIFTFIRKYMYMHIQHIAMNVWLSN